MSDKAYEITLIFKSGAVATFIAGEFNLKQGDEGTRVWDWTNSPIPFTVNCEEFEVDNIDCVLKKEIIVPPRLS